MAELAESCCLTLYVLHLWRRHLEVQVSAISVWTQAWRHFGGDPRRRGPYGHAPRSFGFCHLSFAALLTLQQGRGRY